MFSTHISAHVPGEWAWGWQSAGPSSRLTMDGSRSNRSLEFGRRFASRSQPRVSTMPEPTVYVVDDDPDMLDSLRWLFKTVGLRVEPFSSAADFLHNFSPEGPGCLVFDV